VLLTEGAQHNWNLSVMQKVQAGRAEQPAGQCITAPAPDDDQLGIVGVFQ